MPLNRFGKGQIMPCYKIIVRGRRPNPTQGQAGGGVGVWKDLVAQKAREAYPEGPFEIQRTSKFYVGILFYLTDPLKVNQGDLDNLAKPILDVLFKSPYRENKPTGQLLQCNDVQVFKLCLLKDKVDKGSDQGADIFITDEWFF